MCGTHVLAGHTVFMHIRLKGKEKLHTGARYMYGVIYVQGTRAGHKYMEGIQ